MDFLLHLTISLFATFLLTLLFLFKIIKEETYYKLITVLILTMIGKELYDYLDYGLFSLKDLLYDMLGLIFGMSIGITLHKYRKQ